MTELEKRKRCVICNRRKLNHSIYCIKHFDAKKILMKYYEQWQRAYGVLSWESYIQKVLKIEDKVGIWIIEVIKHELYFKPS